MASCVMASRTQGESALIAFGKYGIEELLILLILGGPAQSGILSVANNNEVNQRIEDYSSKNEDNLDLLFGPDINFPFRPENHRDNSSPVARIGSINNEP